MVISQDARVDNFPEERRSFAFLLNRRVCEGNMPRQRMYRRGPHPSPIPLTPAISRIGEREFYAVNFRDITLETSWASGVYNQNYQPRL
jgi:hypothetical protein